MEPLDVMVLVSLVKPGGSRWTVEAAIVTRLAQLRGGGWCWAAQAAEWTGADEVVCRRALRSLEERRIIKRDPGDSGRDNIRWCGVNDDWRRWRVEWLVEPSQVAAQLALAAQQRDESPLTRVFARSLGARSLRRIARSFDARCWEEDLDEVAGIARSGIARSGKAAPSDRAVQIARSVGRRRAALERAIRGEAPKEVLPHSGDADSDRPTSVVRTEEERLMDLGGLAIKELVIRASRANDQGAKYLRGVGLRPLNDLLEQHGIEGVTAGLGYIEPDTLTPPQFLERLQGIMALPEDRRAPAAPAPSGVVAPAVWVPPPGLTDEEREAAQAQVEALRRQRRFGWQDVPSDGEASEAIAQ